MADPTFMPAVVFAKRKKNVWDTPDFNPHAESAPSSTELYNKANQDAFKAIGLAIKNVIKEDPKNISRGSILPFTKDKNTGEVSLGLPGFVKDPLVGLGTYDKILKGELDPNSPEAVKAALDTSLGVGLGGVSVSRRSSPNELGLFMGSNAKTFNTADAIRAEELKAQGANAREIWDRTQNRIWNTGIRQEIDDSVMKIKNPLTEENLGKEFIMDSDGFAITHLNRLIDHPELFKAYPSLKNMTVRIDPSYTKGDASYSGGSHGTITLGLDDVGKVDTQSLLHEIQHAIQAKEGWQGGGSPDMFGGRIIILPNGEMKKLNSFTEYQTLAGEWEARQTQLREKLTAKQRAKTFPDDTSSTYDLPSGSLNVHNPDYVLHRMKAKNK